MEKISFAFGRITTVLLAALCSVSAYSQVTVSNLDNTVSYESSVYWTNWLAGSFTTDSSNYSLSSVTVLLNAVLNSSTPLILSVYSDNTGLPGTLLETLSGSNPTTGGQFTFTSSGLTLSPDTTYFLVGSTPGYGVYHWNYTTDTSELITGGSGWTLGNDMWTSNNSGTSWNNSSGAPFMFSVTATSAVPEPGAYATLAGLAALALLAFRRRQSS
jgi:MYXO-CTERM domain-containing protein